MILLLLPTSSGLPRGGGGRQTQAAGATSTADAAPPGVPRAALVRFQYENAQLQPAKYSFVIGEDGAGRFHSEPGTTPPADTASYHPLAQPLDRAIQLTPAAAGQIFLIARSQNFFAGSCLEPKSKVAYQGTKQLSYSGPDGSGACTYNWSKVTSIQKLTAMFESIAFTIEEGRRLEIQHKHDRLSLDLEMSGLQQAVKEGRAAEIQTIEPTLKEIIGDETVMERVRSRARKLLEAAGGS